MTTDEQEIINDTKAIFKRAAAFLDSATEITEVLVRRAASDGHDANM